MNNKSSSRHSLASVHRLSSSIDEVDLSPATTCTVQDERLNDAHLLDRQVSLSRKLRTSHTYDQGSAAEFLVMADLLSQGYQAHLMGATCSYDIIVDLGGEFCRIQVKSTAKLNKTRARSRPQYVFECRRGGNRPSKFARDYVAGEYDVLACVAMDIKTIAYLPKPSTTSVLLKHPSQKRYPTETKPYINELPFTKALESFERKSA